MASIATRRRNGITKARPIWPGNARSTGLTNTCAADSAATLCCARAARTGSPDSCRRRRFRVEDALEAFAVLKKDQHPQYGCHQCRSNARRCHRQVKRKDVVELRGKQCQRKWHEKAEEQ